MSYARDERRPPAAQDTQSLDHPRSAGRVHVPELERWATNQRPKTSDHTDPRLFRYEGSDLYQWWSRKRDATTGVVSVFETPCDEPFVMEPSGAAEDRREMLDWLMLRIARLCRSKRLDDLNLLNKYKRLHKLVARPPEQR